MNLLRKKSWDILKLYTVTSRKGFANLSNDAKMKLSKSLSSKWFKLLEILNDPKRYYEELLKEADVSEKGLYNIESNHLTQILQRSKTSEDINVVLSAYYNLLGHGTAFRYTLVDSIIRKAIEVDNPQATHDLIVNHNYLRYYPHPALLDELMQYYRENKKVEEATKLINSIHTTRNLLKFNPKFFEEAILLSSEAEDHSLVFLVYDYCLNRNINISKEALQALISSLYNFSLKSSEQKKRHPVISKIIKSVRTQHIGLEDWLKLSLSQVNYLEDAILIFENLVSTESELEEDTSFQNTDFNKEYFSKMFEKLEDRPKYFNRFVNALKSIQDKYSVDKELGNYIEGNIDRIKKTQSSKALSQIEGEKKELNDSQLNQPVKNENEKENNA